MPINFQQRSFTLYADLSALYITGADMSDISPTNQWTVQQWLDQANRALTTADHDVPFPSIIGCEVAIAAYDAALQIAPGNSEALDGKAYALFMLGNQLSDSGRYEAANAAYDQSLQATPNNPRKDQVFSRKCFALHKLERYEEVIAACDQVLVIRPDNEDALMNKGTALHRLRLYEEAIIAYERVLEDLPDHHQAISNKGAALYDLGHYEDAIVAYDQALAINPNDTVALHNKELLLNVLRRTSDEGT